MRAIAKKFWSSENIHSCPNSIPFSSLTSSSSIEEHRNHVGMSLHQRLLKLKASREMAAENGSVPDTFSYDTISITSTSSVEETRAAIAKVIRCKLEQQQIQR